MCSEVRAPGPFGEIGFAASRGKAKSMNPSPTAVSSKRRRKEDLVYQVVTVAAMVSMLASVWIF